MPWAGSSGEYINRRVKISALVALERGNTNHTERMPVFDATIYLIQRIFAPIWKCEMQEQAFCLTEDLATSIPMLKLFCRPDLDAVHVLKRAILDL